MVLEGLENPYFYQQSRPSIHKTLIGGKNMLKTFGLQRIESVFFQQTPIR